MYHISREMWAPESFQYRLYNERILENITHNIIETL